MTDAGRKTVLLVDDDEDFLSQLRLQLEAAGFAVVAAASQAAAEEALAQSRPDLAVVDLMLERPDGGFALCYHIKKADPSIPVIIVSAVTSETGIEFDAATEEERAWVMADAFLAKPLRAGHLRAQAHKLLAEAPFAKHGGKP